MEEGIRGIKTYLESLGFVMTYQWSSTGWLWPCPSNRGTIDQHCWVIHRLPQVLWKGMGRNFTWPLFRAEKCHEPIGRPPKNHRTPIRNDGLSYLNWLWLFGCRCWPGFKCILWSIPLCGDCGDGLQISGFAALIIHDEAWWFKSSRRQTQAKVNFEATQTVPWCSLKTIRKGVEAQVKAFGADKLKGFHFSCSSP